jgi:WD40 repeat protein
MKLPVTATRLAPFDPSTVLRIRWTPGDDQPDVYTLDLLDIDKPAAVNPISNRSQAHATIAVAPAGKFFATGGGIYRTWRREGSKAVVDERKADTHVYLWSRDTFAKQPVDLGEPVGEGALLAFTSDGTKLLVATSAKKLFVIDAAAGKVDGSIPLPESPTALAASATFAAVVGGRRVHIVRLNDSVVAVASGLASARSVLFSNDGSSLFVGGEDGLLRRYGYEPLAK